MNTTFDKQKSSSLEGVDLSRKGSIDEPIQPLISYINSQPDYFTTSSCSGRILIVDNIQSMKDIKENAVFKFEPFVLHVQCRNLQAAQTMLQCGVASGFRNSGISVGNKGRFITAIRSTHSLDAPLSCKGKLLVSDEYLNFLVESSNQKMRENLNRIERFFNNLKTAIDKKTENYSKEGKSTNKDSNVEKRTKTKVKDTNVEKVEIEDAVDGVKDTNQTNKPDKQSLEDVDICECLGFMDEG